MDSEAVDPGAVSDGRAYRTLAHHPCPGLRDGELPRRPRVVFGFTITRGRIVEINLLADPERLRQLDLAILDA